MQVLLINKMFPLIFTTACRQRYFYSCLHIPPRGGGGIEDVVHYIDLMGLEISIAYTILVMV